MAFFKSAKQALFKLYFVICLILALFKMFGKKKWRCFLRNFSRKR